MPKKLLSLLLCLILFGSGAFARGSSHSGNSSSHSRTARSSSKTVHPRSYSKNGRIKRSAAAKDQFLRETGYPHGRKGYVVDHVNPLACGGADAPSNMQWQTKGGIWYLTDMVTTEAVDRDPKKGWFPTLKEAQKAANKLNSMPEEKRREYVRLTNGFVAVSQGWSRDRGFDIGVKNITEMESIEKAYLEKIDRKEQRKKKPQAELVNSH